MAEIHLPHGRDDVPAAPPAHPDAGCGIEADPAEREAFLKALAHWPLLAEIDRYLAWGKRATPGRNDDPDAPR